MLGGTPGPAAPSRPLGIALMGIVSAARSAGAVAVFGRRTRTRIGPTWDCGLRGLTPRMEYTATGFSKPIRMIFKALFRPRREVQREYDFSPYFATTLRFESHIEEAFVTRLYRPLNRRSCGLSRRMRALQAGSIQAYLIYIFITLLLLLCLRYEPRPSGHRRCRRCCCWLLAPLISGCIRNWKAKLQNRRGPRIWQPYFDLAKFLRKDMVISEHASWVFPAMPYVRVHLHAAGRTDGADGDAPGAVEPVRRRAGLVGLLALGRFFLAWAGWIRRARSAAWAAAAR